MIQFDQSIFLIAWNHQLVVHDADVLCIFWCLTSFEPISSYHSWLEISFRFEILIPFLPFKPAGFISLHRRTGAAIPCVPGAGLLRSRPFGWGGFRGHEGSRENDAGDAGAQHVERSKHLSGRPSNERETGKGMKSKGISKANTSDKDP